MSNRNPSAHDLGIAIVRVRRIDDGRRLRGPSYEVSVTPVGSQQPESTTKTRTPLSIVERHVGRDEGPTVIKAADRLWSEQDCGWATLFPGDAD